MRAAALALALAPILFVLSLRAARAEVDEVRVDWATYNPVSMVMRAQERLEKELGPDGIRVRWVQSAGSNKALEFLRSGSIDFGSTAGAAALIGRLQGDPIRAIYAYSKPEWTALVTKDEAIRSVADLKGKRVAVTRGTDPHIFLVRALADAKLTEKDLKLVLVQHADGRVALERGHVDAWAGLDPMMADIELHGGARLFYRDADANTYGILNVREAFAEAHPQLVKRVLAVYEATRKWCVEHPSEVARVMVKITRLPEPVIARQLERTDLSSGLIGPKQVEAIVAAGLALRSAGVLEAEADVPAAAKALVDTRYLASLEPSID